jgi:hypothetical protein
VVDESKLDLKDSGNRNKFATGAVRDLSTGKGRYDFLPPHAIFRLATVYEKGAVKYAPRNWEKGIPLSRFWDSACRHWFQVLEGKTDEDHAAQAMWNVAGFIQTKYWIEQGVLPISLDDMPKYIASPRGDGGDQTYEKLQTQKTAGV